jgi:hypothetical protein
MSTTTGQHTHEHDGHVHSHTHTPAHAHEHPSGTVVETGQHHGPSFDGSVVLDIGEGIGAVVLHVPPELAGLEIDIVGLSPGTTSTHSLVRPRLMPGGTVYAAVYPGLPAGSYRIAATVGKPAVDVEVAGGCVADVDWRA